MKILVTGVAGFIGFHVAHKLIKKKYNVIGLDNLNNYKSDIKVTDPIANKEEAKTFYGIDLVNFKELKDINIIILAVAHDQYVQTKKEEWLGLFSGSGVFIDVKGVVNKEYFKNTDITYWRL